MSKLSFSMSVSLDGYVNDQDGGIDWHRVSDELHRHHNDLNREIDCHVYGRRLYETMLFWETFDENPDADETMREFARIWREIPKYVVSRTLSSVPDGFQLLDGNLEDDFKAVMHTHDGEISVGGPTLAGALTKLGFVDEFRRYIVPVVIGGGTPYFTDDVDHLELTLLETRTFDNGVILEHYGL